LGVLVFSLVWFLILLVVHCRYWQGTVVDGEDCRRFRRASSIWRKDSRRVQNFLFSCVRFWFLFFFHGE
jgi:hypothetical protein